MSTRSLRARAMLGCIRLMTIKCVLLVTMFLVTSGKLAKGDVMAGNFGPPGNLYQAGNGVALTGYTTPSSFTGFVAHAYAFTPSASFSLTELDIALSYVSGTNDGVVSLWTDSGGTLGAVLTA